MTHVLVIEDGSLLRSTLRDLISSLGYRASVCDSIREVRQTLEGQPVVDFILTDYILPDGFGTEAIRLVRRLQGQGAIPAIMVSAWNVQDLPPLTKTFVKPFDIHEVIGAMRCMVVSEGAG